MDDAPTCGKGLAENAVLPTRLAELTASMADILEAHLPALDLTDERAKREYEVYRQLAEDHRLVSMRLEAIGQQMSQYRDLPMGRHNDQAMAAAAVVESFQRFVELERGLLVLLQQRIEQDQRMLVAMGAPHPRQS
jgi:hypothetical protein